MEGTDYSELRAECEGWKIRCEEAQRVIDKLRRECDLGDQARAEIENIQQLVGCNHTEGLSRCVRERLEDELTRIH